VYSNQFTQTSYLFFFTEVTFEGTQLTRIADDAFESTNGRQVCVRTGFERFIEVQDDGTVNLPGLDLA
jgi:hypothetical protein